LSPFTALEEGSPLVCTASSTPRTLTTR
jgi:hypothetical protein